MSLDPYALLNLGGLGLFAYVMYRLWSKKVDQDAAGQRALAKSHTASAATMANAIKEAIAEVRDELRDMRSDMREDRSEAHRAIRALGETMQRIDERTITIVKQTRPETRANGG